MRFTEKLGEGQKMATQLCQKCKQAHPGRVCDYDEKGECAETIDTNEVAQPCDAPSKDEVGTRSEINPEAGSPSLPVRFAAWLGQ
jgi:hypothetical protein